VQWFGALAAWKKALVIVAAVVVLFVPLNALRHFSSSEYGGVRFPQRPASGGAGSWGRVRLGMRTTVAAAQYAPANRVSQEVQAALEPPAAIMREARGAAMQRQTPQGADVGAPVELASAGWGRLIIRSATAAFTVRNITESQQGIVRIADSVGGYIASANVNQPEKTGRYKPPATGTIELRVPNDRFTEALNELRKVGRMTSLDIRSEDISEEYVDLESRLRHWRAQERLVLEMFNNAHRISDMLSVRSELSTIQQQIEQITGRLRYLSARVAMASITVNISEKGPSKAKPKRPTLVGKVKSEGNRLAAAFSKSIEDFVAVLTWVGIGLIYVMWYAALALMAFWIYHRAAPRRRAVAAPGEPPAAL
jgi:hypothetical protein